MQRTIFDHIPKTGGTSIRAAMAQALGEPTRRLEDTAAHHVVIATAAAGRFVSAHLWFYPGERLAPDWYYATLLRDPVDRFLSQYYFQRQHRAQVQDGLVNDPVTVAAVSNDLAGYLADPRPELQRSYANVQACHFAARMCERPHELTASQLLDAAIASLEDFDHVGHYAEIQAFLDSYCQALDLPAQTLPRLNMTGKRKFAGELCPELAEKLDDANRVDTMLLDWVSRRQHGAPAAGGGRPPRRVTADCNSNFGTLELEVCSVAFQGSGTPDAVFQHGERARLRLRCRSRISVDDFTAGIAIRAMDGTAVYGINSKVLGKVLAVASGQEFTVCIDFTMVFPAGDYLVTVALHRGIDHVDRCYHWIDSAARFHAQPENPGTTDTEAGVTFAIESAPASL